MSLRCGCRIIVLYIINIKKSRWGLETASYSWTRHVSFPDAHGDLDISPSVLFSTTLASFLLLLPSAFYLTSFWAK